LIQGPLESDTTGLEVHFYWYGTDKDGEIARYRFAIDDQDGKPPSEWQTTRATDSTFRFTVGPGSTKQHRFKVAAEDDQGHIDPTPAGRVFSSQTIPPTSCVTKGPGGGYVVGTTFAFAWSGTDPDGSETGGPAPVDSFEYMLLRPGSVADPDNPGAHQPLPPYSEPVYLDLIRRATGDALPEPYDDWKWTGIRGTGKKFQGVAPGELVFALRAVDIAGAREDLIERGCNMRRFAVTTKSVGPTLVIYEGLPPTLYPAAAGPIDVARSPLEIMGGQPASFSWLANADFYGGVIDGYTWALNDTMAFPPYDPHLTAITLTPSQLPDGPQWLYVRVRDTDGATTTAGLPLQVVHPAFKDPGAPREILYVDDSLAPGNWTGRIGSYPSDVEETNWWTLTLLSHLGVPVTEWDTYYRGVQDVYGRKPPGLSDLANYSTVIWNVDFNNGAALEQATGLWKTVVGDGSSELAAYLQAGGTLILTGFMIAGNVTNPNTTLYVNSNVGICSGLEPGSGAYELAFFPRTTMGVDGAMPSFEALRTLGARDFIAAWPTEAGLAAGYDSAFIDRGPSGSGAKWTTNPNGSSDPNLSLCPGLPRIDGLKLATDFACDPNAALNFHVEDPSHPIAEAIYRYHGVNMGVDESGAPSPREGLVVGVRVQAHSLETPGGGGIVTPGEPGLVGRTVFIGIPLYFLRDPDALRIIETAFRYVNGSPTLP
jgi:hypothetical protein